MSTCVGKYTAHANSTSKLTRGGHGQQAQASYYVVLFLLILNTSARRTRKGTTAETTSSADEEQDLGLRQDPLWDDVAVGGGLQEMVLT